MANGFLEPSTRTASSFNAAFSRLGGKVITIQEGTSSTKKGETLQDTMRCVECYSDVLVLRHPETGAAKLAAKYVKKPRRSGVWIVRISAECGRWSGRASFAGSS